MKKVQLLLPLACLVFATTVAQDPNPKVDSLLRVLRSGGAGSKVEVLWGIAYELFDVNNPEALFYATRAYQEVWKGGDSLQIVKVGTTYGQLLRRLDQVDESIVVSSRMLPISRRHDFRKYRKLLLNSLALATMFKEHYDKALEHHLESLTLRQEEGKLEEIAITLSNIGFVHYKLGDFELSIDYHNQALELQRSTKDSSWMSTSFLNIGLSYNYLDQCSKALENFELAKKAFKAAADRNAIIGIEYGLGMSYLQMGEFDSSRVHCLRSLALAEKARDQRQQIWDLILLAQLAIAENKIDDLDLWLSKAEKLPAIGTYPDALLHLYKNRGIYCAKVGAYERGFNTLRSYMTLHEATFNEDHNKRVRSALTKFTQKENLEKIHAQARILELQEEVIVRQDWIIFLCVIVSLLTAYTAMVQFRSNTRKKRINEILDECVKVRTTELDRQRDMLQHAFDEQVISRRRVSEEVKALTATLKGLLHLGGREIPEQYLVYLHQANATTEKISRTIDLYKSNGAQYG